MGNRIAALIRRPTASSNQPSNIEISSSINEEVITEETITEYFGKTVFPIRPLNIYCKLHKEEAVNVCLFRDCKEPLGFCNRQQCINLHTHKGKTQKISKTDMDKKWNERVRIYEKYKQELDKKLNRVYDDMLDTLDNLIRFVKNDRDQMLYSLKYCETYEDSVQQILRGKVMEADRFELYKFLNTDPKKIFDTKVIKSLKQFQTVNNKLIKRRAQFSSGLSEIQKESQIYKSEISSKIDYQESKREKQNNSLRIKQNKWSQICEKIKEAKQPALHLLLLSNGTQNDIQMYNLINLEQQRRFEQVYYHLEKLCNAIQLSKLSKVKSITLYTAWHVDEVPQYQEFSRQIAKLQALQEITIISRHPIKSIKSFKALRNRLKIYSEQWQDSK